jgi:hypothetical protein
MREALQHDDMLQTWSLSAAAASVVAMLAGLARLASKQRVDGETRIAGAVVVAGLAGYASVLWMN